MRGPDTMQERLFTMARLEDFVPAGHPLRPVQRMVNEALKGLNGLFNQMHADHGRASIAPEKLIRRCCCRCCTRSKRRLLVEQLHYNLLFRWFVGLAIDDAVWDHSSFSKNRDRLLDHAVVEALFTEVMTLAEKEGLLSDEHFSVDGTLIKAWASHKSFQPKDGPPNDDGGTGRNTEGDWRGKPRSNDTHESTTDPEARLHRKSKASEAILCYQGHVLIENANGLVVNARASQASGFAERENAGDARELPDQTQDRRADKAYDTPSSCCSARSVTLMWRRTSPERRLGIDGRTSTPRLRSQPTHPQTRREPFGWAKTIGHPPDAVPRPRPGQHAVHADDGGQQPRANARVVGRRNVVNEMAGDRYMSSSVNGQKDERKGAPKHGILGWRPCALPVQDRSLIVSLPISTAC
jgi:transposase